MPFLLWFFLFEGNFQVQNPQGLIFGKERFNGLFFAFPDWGTYVWRGLFSKFIGT